MVATTTQADVQSIRQLLKSWLVIALTRAFGLVVAVYANALHQPKIHANISIPVLILAFKAQVIAEVINPLHKYTALIFCLLLRVLPIYRQQQLL